MMFRELYHPMLSTSPEALPPNFLHPTAFFDVVWLISDFLNCQLHRREAMGNQRPGRGQVKICGAWFPAPSTFLFERLVMIQGKDSKGRQKMKK